MGLAFEPNYTRGVIVTPNGTSQTVRLGFTSETLVFSNFGTTIVYVAVGNVANGNSVVASPSCYPVMVNSQVSIGKDQDDDTVAFISPDGAGSLHIIQGIGI